jgi:DNA polymerase III sliding clamp (beta) subunit (PCNA family)
MSHPNENSDFDHINIQSHNDKLVAFGTDRMNFSVQLTELPWIGRDDLFIPTSVLPLLKAMEGDVVVDSDGDKLKVSSVDCGFTIPLFHDRRSMAYSKLLAIKQPLAGIANREELLGLLRAYMGIHAPSGKGMSLSCDVELKVQGEALHLLGEGESFDGAATLRESVDGATIMANAIPLIAALAAFDCDEVAVGFSGGKSPISIEAAVPDGRLAMMAPMRRQ